jgi:hypothetical protein
MLYQGATTFLCNQIIFYMKKFLLKLGLADPQPPQQVKTYMKAKQPIDMEAFSKWSADLNVSIMARGSEFTIRIGNHVKHVSLSDRF